MPLTIAIQDVIIRPDKDEIVNELVAHYRKYIGICSSPSDLDANTTHKSPRRYLGR